jgi:NADH-quinone oxidoreductase subunit M
MSLLNLLILFPFLGAFAILCVPASLRFLIRILAILTAFATMVTAFALFFSFKTGVPSWQFETLIPWSTALGIQYHVGADGVNIGLLFMGAVVGFAAACVSWEIKTRDKEFYILLLVMLGGILGAFASLDLFFLYFFHELALIPTFIMIGVWGRGERRNYAAYQITLYLSVGALLVLLGLVALYLKAGAHSFDLLEITRHLRDQPMSVAAQNLIFPVLLFGFGILVSLWPLHSWAPLGYASAPTATAMLHAGVLKKFGLYGLLRIAIPLMPDGANSWMGILAWLCLGNILYCGLVAMRQKDLNLVIGNSSVAHMGFVFLGLASLNLIGVTGAVLVMVAHGFLAALTFALSGYIYQQTGTLEIGRLGGLLRQMPFIGALLMMAMLAGCGVPGFPNFVGEMMVFFGAWTAFKWVTVLAVWGALVIGGVYMLRAIRNVLHGPLAAEWERVADASNPWRRLPFVLLIALLLVFGFFPSLLTDKIKPVAAEIVAASAPGKTPDQMIHLVLPRPQFTHR